MAANVNSMMSRNLTPWHREGAVIMADHITPAEAIVHAGLDWRVALRPTYFLADKDSKRLVKVADKKTVVRIDNNTPLGIVGNVYRPIQNRDAFAFLDGLVAQGEISIETAGALGDGEKVWVLARFVGGDFTVGGEDMTKSYILFSTAHDGSGSARVDQVNTRVVCANTLAMALRENGRALSIRHSGDVQRNLKIAQKALAVAKKEAQTMAELGDALLRRMFTAEEAQTFLSTLAPRPVALDRDALAKLAKADREKAEAAFSRADSRALNRQQAIRDGLNDPTNRVGDMAGSWWALLNAATLYSDHKVKARGKGSEVARSLWGSGADFKAKALELAVAAVS